VQKGKTKSKVKAEQQRQDRWPSLKVQM